MNGEHDKAKQAIEKMYNTEGNLVKLNNIFEAERRACLAGDEDDASVVKHVTTKQALLTDERYTRSSWTAIALMSF